MEEWYGLRKVIVYGKLILDFLLAIDLIIDKTYFKKRDVHLITFKSGFYILKYTYFLLENYIEIFVCTIKSYWERA